VRWDAFETACPRIAELARDRFSGDQVAMVGTMRADGSPRISGQEPDFAADRLCLGMMWRSRKALDLLRDPRITVVSVPSDRMNAGGDVKLSGLAVEELDPDIRKIFRETIQARIDWAPDEPNFHLFSLDVREAAYMRFGDDRLALHWDEARGFRELRHPDADDEDSSS
jgi:hypothetical protein